MATLGFATRLKLQGFKIADVNNSGTMWFYSIQGVFRAVFEFGNMGMQRGCLQNLKDVWLSRFEEKLLQSESTLVFHENPQTDMSYKCTTPFLDTTVRQIESSDTVKSANDKTPHHVGFSEQLLMVATNEYENVRVTQNKDCNKTIHEATLLEESCETDADTVKKQRLGMSLVLDRSNSGRVHNKSYEYPALHGKELKPHTDDELYLKESNVANLVDCIAETVLVHNSSLNTDEKQEIVNYILIVVRYLTHLMISSNAKLENGGGELFKIMISYLEALESDSEFGMPVIDSFGLQKERSVLLNVVSEWLGKEFHKMKPEIENKVEEFKRQNLYNIDCLPPKERLIDMLFPSFMKTLLSNWISQDDETGHKTQTDAFDHTYVHGRSESTERDMILRQMQLILELGTNCLVSGMAHVVYSQLRIQK